MQVDLDYLVDFLESWYASWKLTCASGSTWYATLPGGPSVQVDLDYLVGFLDGMYSGKSASGLVL